MITQASNLRTRWVSVPCVFCCCQWSVQFGGVEAFLSFLTFVDLFCQLLRERVLESPDMILDLIVSLFSSVFASCTLKLFSKCTHMQDYYVDELAPLSGHDFLSVIRIFFLLKCTLLILIQLLQLSLINGSIIAYLFTFNMSMSLYLRRFFVGN